MKRFPAHLPVLSLALATILGLILFLPGAAAAQDSVTLNFDGQNGQPGNGATSFSFMGSNWSGGRVFTQGITSLYASGVFAYHPEPNATVTFDDPVDRVEFFFVHGGGTDPGTATAFNGSGDQLGMVSSNAATTFGDPANFETLDPSDTIARIEFSNGVIDNFTYVFAGSAANPGTLALSSSNFPVDEGGGSITVTVNRVNGTDGMVSVGYSTNDGTASAPADYQTASGTLNWADGDGSSKSFQVSIVDDGEAEGQERFGVTLDNPDGGANLGRSSATVTIGDNDGGDDDGGGNGGGSGGPGMVRFTRGVDEPFEVSEGNSAATVDLERVDGSEGQVTVQVSATGGTATEGSDFMPVTETVTFSGGQTSAQVMIPILQDDEDEGAETIHLDLSGPTGGAMLGDLANTDVAILDDDGLDSCDPSDPQTLCLGQGDRFKVQVSFRNQLPEGGTTTDRGDALPLIRQVNGGIQDVTDSGLFTFFGPNNAELLVKVLDSCPFANRFWVFYAATTNVEFTLTVTDTEAQEFFFRSNPLGQTAETILATDALDTCP